MCVSVSKCVCVCVCARVRALRSALSLVLDTKLRKDSLARGELEVPLTETFRADYPSGAQLLPQVWGPRNSGALQCWWRRPGRRAECPRGGGGRRLRTEPGRWGRGLGLVETHSWREWRRRTRWSWGTRTGSGGGSPRPSEAGCSLPARKGAPNGALRSGAVTLLEEGQDAAQPARPGGGVCKLLGALGAVGCARQVRGSQKSLKPRRKPENLLTRKSPASSFFLL